MVLGKTIACKQCLIAIAEKLRQSLDKGDARAVLFTDLLKVLDSLPHELLIAKLHAYGTDLPSLKILDSYLVYRDQRICLNITKSSWSEVLFEVTERLIFGHLLFNISVIDLFLFIPNFDVASYVYDKRQYCLFKE